MTVWDELKARGLIAQVTDEEEIKEMEGFGEKSFNNLKASVEKARETTLPQVLYYVCKRFSQAT